MEQKKAEHREWYQLEFRDASPCLVDLFLAKNLAGSGRKVSGEEFIEWAKAGRAPDDEARTLIYEALGGLNGAELIYVYFDGRTHPDNIAKLIVDCGLDETYIWNNWLRSFHPELRIVERKEDWELRDKMAMADWNYEGFKC